MQILDESVVFAMLDVVFKAVKPFPKRTQIIATRKRDFIGDAFLLDRNLEGFCPGQMRHHCFADAQFH